MFKQKLWRASAILLAGFALLFVFRLIYGYTSKFSDRNDESISDFFDGRDDVKRNYASDSYKFEKSGGYEKPSGGVSQGKEAMDAAPAAGGGQVSVSQKYEKIGSVRSRTEKFEEDEKKTRGLIKEYNGVIQLEENEGNKGSRRLHLLVGVRPEHFDSFMVAVMQIAKVQGKQITKIDKTSEFKTLNAKRISLETIRASLIELKTKGGNIEEYINLQNRILEIEQELQDLGVSLGDFSEENEFCTVRFTLAEGRVVPLSFMHRVKVAFEWSIQYYLGFIAIVALCTFSAFFILLIIDKLKVLSGIIKRLNE
jgi:hypothetical protein